MYIYTPTKLLPIEIPRALRYSHYNKVAATFNSCRDTTGI